MKNLRIITIVFFTLNFFIGCEEGEFIADTSGAINLTEPKKDALCEGGEPQGNGRILIPFRWTLEGDDSYDSFTVNIYEASNLEAPVVTSQTQNGTQTSIEIELERGRNLTWEVIGNISGSTDVVPSLKWGFYSESIPQNDNAPLPTRILSIERRLDNFFITWDNDNESVDELTYNIYRSISPGIQDISNENNYTKIGNTRSETDSKELTLRFTELPDRGEYIFRVETIKSISSSIQFTTNSYSKFTY
ncbi:hypothetical protein GCM10011414_07250 [Croceivirga lutea]|uniref:hypothetical protein n=1 Tax=Croceivirga lutea TaxID=1775167 RepID=UPI00163B28B2|nr:hypothetical protein [Croceivirga lutea]GGG40283.1 hypothetical protein GCM10011414_07250 [Croceivirga lutea]